MRLENERLCVEITELGAEILRVYDKKYGREVVWERDPAYWKLPAAGPVPECGEDIPEYCADQWDTLSDLSARICPGQYV